MLRASAGAEATAASAETVAMVKSSFFMTISFSEMIPYGVSVWVRNRTGDAGGLCATSHSPARPKQATLLQHVEFVGRLRKDAVALGANRQRLARARRAEDVGVGARRPHRPVAAAGTEVEAVGE